MKKTTHSLLTAAALAGLAAGTLAQRVMAADAGAPAQEHAEKGDKASCKSKDGCKAKDSCKAKDGCKAKDSCKAKDGCKAKESCKAKEGCKAKDASGEAKDKK